VCEGKLLYALKATTFNGTNGPLVQVVWHAVLRDDITCDGAELQTTVNQAAVEWTE